MFQLVAGIGQQQYSTQVLLIEEEMIWGGLPVDGCFCVSSCVTKNIFIEYR